MKKPKGWKKSLTGWMYKYWMDTDRVFTWYGGSIYTPALYKKQPNERYIKVRIIIEELPTPNQ